MNRDLVIISAAPFSKHYYEIFGVALLSKYFNVRVLDCTAWVQPSFWAKQSDTCHAFPGHSVIGGWGEFTRTLSTLLNPIAILENNNSPIFRRIHGELIRRGVPIVAIRVGLLPVAPRTGANVFGKLRNALKRGNVWQSMSQRVYRVLLPPLPIDILILAGEAGLDGVSGKVHHTIYAHSTDYDTYLKQRELPAGNAMPYAVFLDEDIVHSTDWSYNGISPPATEVGYYDAMNNWFEKFEHNTGLRVVIAAHPRSRYREKPHLYRGREVVYGQTADLVRDADLILAHCSTSISFAVLWRKPLVFLTTNELNQSHISDQIKQRSQLFHAPLVNCDQSEPLKMDVKVWLHVNEADYSDYKRKYIKPDGTPDRLTWEIFSDYVKTQLD